MAEGPEHRRRAELARPEVPSERWVRIIPVAFIMYTIAFIDRTNISLAKPWIVRELNLTPTQAGSIDGVFFWGYLVLQIPGGYLASRWSAKKFVSLLLVAWGACSVLCGLARTGRELWMMRLLLGVAEGGVWPAVLVLLSHWFPRAERARANAYWMLCLPVAVVVSSPVSGWILGRWNWRVLLVAEGLLPILWLVIWLAFMDDHPQQAHWISSGEREHLDAILAREGGSLKPSGRIPILKALASPLVLAMVGVYFLLNVGNYGYLFWLPTALKSIRGVSSFVLGLLYAIPYIITAAGMVVVSRHSDRHHERRWHVAGALAWGGMLLLAGVALSKVNPLLSFACLCLAEGGSYGALGPFWAIPTETMPAAVSGSAMGLINALGNLGGYFGPLAVGYLNGRTGNFVVAFGVLGAGLLAGGIVAAGLFPESSAAKTVEAKPSAS
jgi:sugar phosphate permease